MKNNTHMLESRIGNLEAALENLLECFDTSSEPFTTSVVVDGAEEEAYVATSTGYVIERAMEVLWNETDWFMDEEEEE